MTSSPSSSSSSQILHPPGNMDEEGNLKLPPVVHRLQRGEKMPVCVILVGMAGSGKTTLLTQLQRSLEDMDVDDDNQQKNSASAEAKQVDGAKQESDTNASGTEGTDRRNEAQTPKIESAIVRESAYCVNLDPATLQVPYDVSIDIRDTVDYKQVMQQHKLGPNGAIMTSLNLFATKFDQVMNILEKRAYENRQKDAGANNSQCEDNEGEVDNDKLDDDEDDDDDDGPMDYILVDTPGQIEAFTWSASGTIISESLASAFPTVLCFVVDTVRCASSPNTFMSNMLYACSMLYRTRLPLIVCFNKTDVVSHEFCLEWMRDYEAFQQALDDVSDEAGFYGSLTRSLSLVLDEFYSSFANACGVSAVTGDGIAEFWRTVQKAARVDFATDYIEDLKNRIEEQDARKRAIARNSVERLQRDLGASAED